MLTKSQFWKKWGQICTKKGEEKQERENNNGTAIRGVGGRRGWALMVEKVEPIMAMRRLTRRMLTRTV